MLGPLLESCKRKNRLLQQAHHNLLLLIMFNHAFIINIIISYSSHMFITSFLSFYLIRTFWVDGSPEPNQWDCAEYNYKKQ